MTDPDSPDFQSFRRHKIALYDGALRFVDREIERLLDGLDEFGGLAGTLVVITSDHGEEFWDHAETERQAGDDPRGIWGVGHGHSLFEELLRVPLVFWGQQIAEGITLDCPIGQIDIAPTVLELLAIARGPDMRGLSLIELLIEGSEAVGCPEVPFVADAIAWGPESRAVIWKGIKLIERGDGVMLFDLRSDPGESRNLASDRPQLVAALRSMLRDQVDEIGQLGEPMIIDDETLKNLRTLGYLQ